MKKFLLLIVLAAAAVSCGIYSFTGTNIQSDVKTITIPFVEYKALRVNPSLSNDLTEALQDKFRKLTSLEQVDHPGEFVHRQGAQVDAVSSVYHCATVALKMSSTIFSMMVSHRVPSTASRDWVASKSS